MGYVEETGSAQHFRDARITTIYEGTTGIQANDLVGRKILMDGGEALTALLDEMAGTAATLGATAELSTLGEALEAAVADARGAMQALLENAPRDRNVAGAAGVNLLLELGYLCGGWLMGQSALRAAEQLAAGGGDRAFLEAKRVTVRFYFEHLLPRAAACHAAVMAGPEALMALAPEQF